MKTKLTARWLGLQKAPEATKEPPAAPDHGKKPSDATAGRIRPAVAYSMETDLLQMRLREELRDMEGNPEREGVDGSVINFLEELMSQVIEIRRTMAGCFDHEERAAIRELLRGAK